MITKSIFPSSWKTAKILPLPKKTNPGISDFRPIAILPFLSKVFEKLLFNQMSDYIDNNNLLEDLQSGFRKSKCCTYALLKIVDDIRQNIDVDKLTFLVLLDFSKAFDSVDHSLLFNKLKSHFKFGSTAIKLLQSYLIERYQLVSCNGTTSTSLQVTSGVPQGSILGPVLFSVFINDLPGVIKHSNYHMYADDVQIYLSCSRDSIHSAVNMLNTDLCCVNQWAREYKLLLNPAKTVSLIISRNHIDITSFPKLVLNDSTIAYKESARNLGIIFDTQLSWKHHISTVVAKVYSILRKLSVRLITPLYKLDVCLLEVWSCLL